ncbi:MAG TPA: non-homologous end-joining DNA ligase [Terriglobales bacterium]|nr:non-homologous end-joining DNA ligase [Terriglobales bacterium]
MSAAAIAVVNGKESVARTTTNVEIQGKHLELSNLDKVMYPAVGFTKGQVIDYYVRIAPVLLPHLRGRPLTMKRYPNGVTGQHFYEKNCPSHRPEWVKTAKVWSEGNNRWMDYCLVEDLPTLVWAANLADLELHTSLSLAKDIMRPTMMVFDLDPGEPANIVQCCEVGLRVRQVLGHFGLQSFAKTSGSKGLQVYVPLNTPVTYDQTKGFAHALARLLEREHPDKVVSDMKKVLRVGKVFVDWSQNDDHKTTVCVYSLRAKERPTGSTPVTWEEVEQALARKNASMLVFEAAQVIERMEKSGDLFVPVLELKQKLPDLGAIEGPAAEKLSAVKSLAAGAGRPKTRRVAPPKSTTRAGATSRKASPRKRA